jgi:hypothetical protein
MLDDTNFTPTWECAHDCGSNGNSESKSGGEHPKVNVTTSEDADADDPCEDPRPARASYARVAESVPAPASNASVPAPTILDVALNPSSRFDLDDDDDESRGLFPRAFAKRGLSSRWWCVFIALLLCLMS